MTWVGVRLVLVAWIASLALVIAASQFRDEPPEPQAVSLKRWEDVSGDIVRMMPSITPMTQPPIPAPVPAPKLVDQLEDARRPPPVLEPQIPPPPVIEPQPSPQRQSIARPPLRKRVAWAGDICARHGMRKVFTGRWHWNCRR